MASEMVVKEVDDEDGKELLQPKGKDLSNEDLQGITKLAV